MENVWVKRYDLGKKLSEDEILTVRIGIPALNEEENLDSLLIKLKALGFCDIVVIDGKSTDKTCKIARSHGAKVILQNGQGKGDAVRQFFKENHRDVDALVLMDADGSMGPQEIALLVKGLKSGADLIKGSRFMKGGYTYDMSLLRMIGNKFFISMVNLFFSTKYSDLCYGYMAFNSRTAEMISPLLKAQNFEIETEILVKAKKLGLNVIEVPSIEYKRKNGKSNLKTFKDGFKILQTIFKTLFS